MAECYHCGGWIDKGQGYRRNVHTGSSSRTSYGTRSSNYSTGDRYALRTLCASCATTNDAAQEKARKNVKIALVIIAVLVFSFLFFIRVNR